MVTITSLAVKTTILTAINDALNGGTWPSDFWRFNFVDETRFGPDIAVTTQTLLGTLTCSDPAGVVSTVVGVPTLTFSAITSTLRQTPVAPRRGAVSQALALRPAVE